MSDLHNKNCIPCRGGIPAFDISEIHKYLKKIDGWDVKKNEDESYFIEKNFKFNNFSESQQFINEVGNIADKLGVSVGKCNGLIKKYAKWREDQEAYGGQGKKNY